MFFQHRYLLWTWPVLMGWNVLTTGLLYTMKGRLSETTTGTILTVITLVVGLLIQWQWFRDWKLYRRSKAQLSMVVELKRQFAQLLRQSKAYAAVDSDSRKIILVTPSEGYIAQGYTVYIGEAADESDYDPVSMQDVRFATAVVYTFYFIKDLIVDKSTHAAKAVDGEIVLMDELKKGWLGYRIDYFRAHPSVKHASLDELHFIQEALSRFEPIEVDFDEMD